MFTFVRRASLLSRVLCALLVAAPATFRVTASAAEPPGSGLVTDERDRFTLYRVRLSEVPLGVCAEDFHVDLLGTQFVHVTIDGSDIDWKIRLKQSIPPGLIFYPEYSAIMDHAGRHSATWDVSVRIPKYYELDPIRFEREEL